MTAPEELERWRGKESKEGRTLGVCGKKVLPQSGAKRWLVLKAKKLLHTSQAFPAQSEISGSQGEEPRREENACLVLARA